ncbi:MAG: periplasmic solute binding protein [Candidatus Eremiobacteraeota bacterium]|nr:periplasmic solute binding protein [Candidatus Eremiobacteraeota bacterium]
MEWTWRACAVICAAALSACSAPRPQANPVIPVVAAENVWGSVVAQIGGSRVRVRSILTDPNADPHEFESDVGTARAVADARYVVLNGVGYDAWADKLLAAGGRADRVLLRAGDVVGKQAGANPHVWYDPSAVARVADRIESDLDRIDPAGAAYYRGQRILFAQACRPYQGRIAAIRSRFRGRRVGATEDIVEYLTSAAGLTLTTPPAFMRAVADGTEPPAGDVLTLHRQIEARTLAALLYNTQTSTSVTRDMRDRARARGIPIVTVTETVVPPNGRFEDWQLDQVRRLEAALSR